MRDQSSTPRALRFLWSAPAPLPAGWDDLPAGRPLISVSLGSAGRAELLPEVLAALGDLPVNVVHPSAGSS